MVNINCSFFAGAKNGEALIEGGGACTGTGTGAGYWRWRETTTKEAVIAIL